MNELQRDHELARLLGQLSEELHKGRRPDLDAVAAQHPEVADELRQLWAAAQLADELGRDGASNPPLPVAPPPTPLPRDFGGYVLLEELGRGGMGVVYRAWERSLDRIVALKMIRAAELASPEDRARFHAEAQAAAGLTHEHIVPVYAVHEQDGQAYFTMQYVDGATLAQRLSQGPLPPRQAAEILLSITRAMQHAHEHGLLHRDLKPSNVLLANPRRELGGGDALPPGLRQGFADVVPKISDFGLAKRLDHDGGLTSTGAIVGTPSYMAPEQAAGSRGALGPATDVYGLGAVLYEMLTGRPPFQAANPVDTLFLVLEQDAVPPRLLNPRVDRDLELICLKCLQKPPDLRYRSAADLAADLLAYLEGSPVSARPSGLLPLVSRMFRESHHAAVLENWGLLWMWHSLKIFLLCVVTNIMLWAGVTSHWPYLVLWSVGLIVWGTIFWALRRRGGPVMAIERYIAHAWAAGIAASIAVFTLEVLLVQAGLNLPVLALSPVLAVAAGMVFLIKGGMLSGSFYVAAAVLFATAVPMALFPSVAPLLFGIASAVCFFFPGLKYYRQRVRAKDV